LVDVRLKISVYIIIPLYYFDDKVKLCCMAMARTPLLAQRQSWMEDWRCLAALNTVRQDKERQPYIINGSNIQKILPAVLSFN
jgi:hypothetical protein